MVGTSIIRMQVFPHNHLFAHKYRAEVFIEHCLPSIIIGNSFNFFFSSILFCTIVRVHLIFNILDLLIVLNSAVVSFCVVGPLGLGSVEFR